MTLSRPYKHCLLLPDPHVSIQQIYSCVALVIQHLEITGENI